MLQLWRQIGSTQFVVDSRSASTTINVVNVIRASTYVSCQFCGAYRLPASAPWPVCSILGTVSFGTYSTLTATFVRTARTSTGDVTRRLLELCCCNASAPRMQNSAARVASETRKFDRGMAQLLTPSYTGLMYLTIYGWPTRPSALRLRHRLSTAAHLSLTSHHGNRFDPSAVVFLSYHATEYLRPPACQGFLWRLWLVQLEPRRR